MERLCEIFDGKTDGHMMAALQVLHSHSVTWVKNSENKYKNSSLYIILFQQ